MCNGLLKPNERGLEEGPLRNFKIMDDAVVRAYSNLEWSDFRAENMKIEVTGQKAGKRHIMSLLNGEVNGNLIVSSFVLMSAIRIINCTVHGEVEISEVVATESIVITGNTQRVKIKNCKTRSIIIANGVEEVEIINVENPNGVLDIEKAGDPSLTRLSVSGKVSFFTWPRE